MNPDQTISLQTVNGWAILPSSLKRSDRSPRFHLHFLASLAGDVGAQHLIINEANAGYEPPTRDLLERVLRPGDLFVDVGAHWGLFSLQAATHPAGGIEVVAFEPDLINATMLTENVGRNKLSNLVTVIGAACGNKNELAPLVLNTTMGHSIRGIGLAPAARALSKWVPVVTLDGALAVNDGTVYITAGVLGYGIIQPSRFMVADMIERGELQEILTEYTIPSTPLSILYPHRRMSSRVRAFTEWITELANRHPDLGL